MFLCFFNVWSANSEFQHKNILEYDLPNVIICNILEILYDILVILERFFQIFTKSIGNMPKIKNSTYLVKEIMCLEYHFHHGLTLKTRPPPQTKNWKLISSKGQNGSIHEENRKRKNTLPFLFVNPNLPKEINRLKKRWMAYCKLTIILMKRSETCLCPLWLYMNEYTNKKIIDLISK